MCKYEFASDSNTCVFNVEILFSYTHLRCLLYVDDHTRVRLRSHKGHHVSSSSSASGGDEYLNANYVDGFRKPRAYIATQVRSLKAKEKKVQGIFVHSIWAKN